MIKPETVICDQCGSEHKSGNGWYSITPSILEGRNGFMVLYLTKPFLRADNTAHCCGVTCLAKQIVQLAGEPHVG